jgi:hypothetical protein
LNRIDTVNTANSSAVEVGQPVIITSSTILQFEVSGAVHGILSYHGQRKIGTINYGSCRRIVVFQSVIPHIIQGKRKQVTGIAVIIVIGTAALGTGKGENKTEKCCGSQ